MEASGFLLLRPEKALLTFFLTPLRIGGKRVFMRGVGIGIHAHVRAMDEVLMSLI